MFQRKIMLVAVLILSGLLYAYAADITGKWTAEFDTQIGQQKYTFNFKRRIPFDSLYRLPQIHRRNLFKANEKKKYC